MNETCYFLGSRIWDSQPRSPGLAQYETLNLQRQWCLMHKSRTLFRMTQSPSQCLLTRNKDLFLLPLRPQPPHETGILLRNFWPPKWYRNNDISRFSGKTQIIVPPGKRRRMSRMLLSEHFTSPTHGPVRGANAKSQTRTPMPKA